MACDAFLKFDGIEGESTDAQHHGWIEILNYDVDIGQTIQMSRISTPLIYRIDPNDPRYCRHNEA